MAPKAKDAAPKPKGKAKAKAKAKPAEEAPGLPPLPPLTEDQIAWCSQFVGVPLLSCTDDELPLPPTLNSPQIRIWRLMFTRGINEVKAGRHSSADDAMRRVVEKMNDADEDTVVVREHIRVWLKWYDSALDDFLLDLGPADDDDED
jgi:hypothetical protein